MKRSRYTVLQVPDLEVGGFGATVPEIPKIVTKGYDDERARPIASEAIRLYLRFAVA
jgi:predicted RNase H-like HicB family nuclease